MRSLHNPREEMRAVARGNRKAPPIPTKTEGVWPVARMDDMLIITTLDGKWQYTLEHSTIISAQWNGERYAFYKFLTKNCQEYSLLMTISEMWSIGLSENNA
jgi:hypothetical protein